MLRIEFLILTLPNPWTLSGTLFRRGGWLCLDLLMSTAPFTRSALIRAAGTCEPGVTFLSRILRSTAAHPATRGVAIDVPDENIYKGSGDFPLASGFPGRWVVSL